jgi:hypothetical protein
VVGSGTSTAAIWAVAAGDGRSTATDWAVADMLDSSVGLGRRARVGRGQLRFYEHVIPRCQPKRMLLQVADRSGLWPRIAGGCHPARDTGAAIERAGFDIDHSERLMFSVSRFEPSIPHILGVARRG